MRIRGNTITIHQKSLSVNGGTVNGPVDFNGTVNMNGNVLTGIEMPTENGHAVNKRYADDIREDAWKEFEETSKKIDQTAENATNYATTKVRNKTLLASGWSDAAPYLQTVNVEDLTDDRRAMAYPDGPEDAAQEEAFMEQAGKVTSCRRSGSVMTFRCREEKPEIDIPVIVEVYV